MKKEPPFAPQAVEKTSAASISPIARFGFQVEAVAFRFWLLKRPQSLKDYLTVISLVLSLIGAIILP